MHKYCIFLSLFIGSLGSFAVAQESKDITKVEEILAICASDRTRMDQAIDFLKKEITFTTQLPIEEGRDWLPKALMSEKISLSYDNLLTARSNVDLDCKAMDYMATLLSKLHAEQPLGEDTQLVNETSLQLGTSVSSWKKEYIVFWQVLTETIRQYQENIKTIAPNSPAQ